MTTSVMLVLERGEAVIEYTKLAILEAFRDHIRVLPDTIPALDKNKVLAITTTATTSS
jgi:hypothetical protein